jgi:hypothetical protein
MAASMSLMIEGIPEEKAISQVENQIQAFINEIVCEKHGDSVTKIKIVPDFSSMTQLIE